MGSVSFILLEKYIRLRAIQNRNQLGAKCHEADVLLSNFYALEGQWTEVAEARRSKTGLETKKKPGNSIVDLKHY